MDLIHRIEIDSIGKSVKYYMTETNAGWSPSVAWPASYPEPLTLTAV